MDYAHNCIVAARSLVALENALAFARIDEGTREALEKACAYERERIAFLTQRD